MTEEQSKLWKPSVPGFSDDILPYYEIIAQWLPTDAKMVEIGLWYGRSTLFIAEELKKLNKQVIIYSVDFMMSLPNYLSSHVKFLPLSSQEASQKFDDESLDFVFIDADHQYDSVLNDIKVWLPKIRVGGIIAGHDYNDYEEINSYPGVRKAVDECFPNGVDVITRTVWEYRK